MSIKASTGLRNGVMAIGSLRSLINLGTIKLYGGTTPTSADDAESTMLLCTITNASSATGLSLASAATNGELPKTVGEVWSGVCSAGGVVTHYRFVAPGDTGASSPTQVRVQGSVAAVGADLVITSTTLVNGATQTIDYYTIALPTL